MSDSHRERMKDLARFLRPIQSNRSDPLLGIHLERLAQMDLSIREDSRRVDYLMMARMMSGAGLRMSNLLRKFFDEYNFRFFMGGAELLPASINVLEAFFPFRKDLVMFDLSEEADYIFSLWDYMDWYTRGGLPEEYLLAASSLREGVAHSYTVVGDPGNFLITGDEIEFKIAGISLIRRGPELVVLLLAGQREPSDALSRPVELVDFSTSRYVVPPGKEGLRPEPGLTSEDRFLEGTNFERVILTTRINVSQGTHDVRYVLIDSGPTFQIITDDPRIAETVAVSSREELAARIAARLMKYEPLFSAALSLLYLPVYFGEHAGLVVQHDVATMLRSERRKANVGAALREFGPQVVKFERSIAGLSITEPRQRHPGQRITAPELQFASTGYWKAIGPDEVGEDQDGKPMFGKTWVQERTSWVQLPADRVFATKTRIPEEGADPGYIYVMRSASHSSNVYKIGLTRRSVSERAHDLSGATAAPTEFLEIASWIVHDCGAVERAIHARLEYCRVNRRREFFEAPISQIISVIEQVMAEEA